MILDDLLGRLRALPDTPLRQRYLDFVGRYGEAALRRDGGAEHVTASTFVVDASLERVLLCFHRKGGFWVQFGGHLEPGDATVAEAARREAREESGLGSLELAGGEIADLDRHELHAGFSCAAHWDLGFLAVAAPADPLTVSAESLDVRWFPVDGLPAGVPDGFAARLAGVLATAAGRV